MDNEYSGLMIFLILCGISILFPLIFAFRKPSKKSPAETSAVEEISEEEPQFKAIGAVVLDKKAEMFSLGKHHTLEFKVAFMTDEGQTVEMDVSQEVYERLNVSQSGDLVTVNGNFFDFGDGEPIE